ncbi:MAG: DNA-formamidopyrimidine glycosylase family protein [Myxococcota bacterium]
MPRVVHGFVGARVERVETRGKNLLLRFSDHSTIRVHLKMTGRWRLFRAAYPHEDLGIALTTDAGSAVCYRAPDIERIDDRGLAAHPVLASLGPDVLSEAFDPEEAVRRTSPERAVGELLLDQRVACGIGNVYRAEVLFYERADPFRALADTPEPARLWATAARMMRQNLSPGPRNTTGLPHLDHWVYGRQRRPCMRCRTPIRVQRFGQPPRDVYWCPRCQAPR